MKIFIVLIWVSCITFYKASSQDFSMVNRYVEELNRLGETFGQVKSYGDIKGSPYFNDELTEGRIITKDNNTFVLKLRFNIYTDEMEFLDNSKIYSLSRPANIKEFRIGDQIIQYSSYLDGKRVRNGYLFVRHQGNYSLFAKKKIEFRIQEKQQPYSTPKPDRFVIEEDTYYLSTPNKPIQRIVSLKKMLRLFPELQQIIANYSEKKINFRDYNDLKNFMVYINSQKINQ